MVVKIQKTPCASVNTNNLIMSTYFNKKIGPFHMFLSNISRFCIFFMAIVKN